MVYGFIPIFSMVTVYAVMVMVMEMGTCSVPVENPSCHDETCKHCYEGSQLTGTMDRLPCDLSLPILSSCHFLE